jgi:hypothetical protein
MMLSEVPAPFCQHDISSTTNFLWQLEKFSTFCFYLAVILAVLAAKMAVFSAKLADFIVKGQTWADLGGLNRYWQNWAEMGLT